MDDTELMIKAENEALKKGDKVQAMFLDDHIAHIAAHTADLRDAPRDYNWRLVLDHVNEHMEMLGVFYKKSVLSIK